MTYTHLTTDELVLIESYFEAHVSVAKVAQKLARSRQTVYNVYHYLEKGHTAFEYDEQYKKNKARCGRNRILLNEKQTASIQKYVLKGWAPDVIIGRKDCFIPCSVRTLYRMFKDGIFPVAALAVQGKRKPNHYKEKRGKQAFRRSIHQRNDEHPNVKTEFGHLEGDTIVGKNQKSAVITLVECVSKAIITLKPEARTAQAVEEALSRWLKASPRHLFKTITFDCGKEFSNWKSISNQYDIDIYFADPGTPSQRALNENSNGLLRKDGLPKKMDFTDVDEMFIQSVANRRNHIPRKSLQYRTPIEVFLSNINSDVLSNLF